MKAELFPLEKLVLDGKEIFLGGHDGELKPYIYGVSAFDVSKRRLLHVLSEHDGNIDDSEADDSYGFLDTNVGIWQDGDDRHWTTIGIGVKGYYSE